MSAPPDARYLETLQRLLETPTTDAAAEQGRRSTVAKRIASAHRGDLTADRYAGKGARFTLRIPALT